MAWGRRKKVYYDSDYVTVSEYLLLSLCKRPCDCHCIILMFLVCGLLGMRGCLEDLTVSIHNPEGKSKEELDAEDQEEEEEAKSIQKRLVGSLSEDDYDLHLLQVPSQEPRTSFSWSLFSQGGIFSRK